jgi:hypothetical protein
MDVWRIDQRYRGVGTLRPRWDEQCGQRCVARAGAERTLESPDLVQVREAVERMLTGHEPYPAVAVDRHWKLLAFDQAIRSLLDWVYRALVEPPGEVPVEPACPCVASSRPAHRYGFSVP